MKKILISLSLAVLAGFFLAQVLAAPPKCPRTYRYNHVTYKCTPYATSAGKTYCKCVNIKKDTTGKVCLKCTTKKACTSQYIHGAVACPQPSAAAAVTQPSQAAPIAPDTATVATSATAPTKRNQ